MMNHGGFAMHQSWCGYDGCSKYLGETLMAETNSKDGDVRSKFCYDGAGDSGLPRGTWAWRNDDVGRVLCCNSIERDGIVAVYFHGNRRIEFTQSLDQIVSEGVVIIDDDDHERLPSRLGFVCNF